MIPKHLCRYPTRAAVNALAARFDLPNESWMQDWEWEVADPERIDEFISSYRLEELDDDERFTLMEMILHSFECLGESLSVDPRWEVVLSLLDTNFRLHAHSLWYWATPETVDPNDQFAITSAVRPILEKHRGELFACD